MNMKNYSRHEHGSSDFVDKFLSELGPKSYSFEDLQRFTSNFSTSNKVGSGGYGEVYKGQFPNGVQVAVKVLAKVDVVEETFMAEVSTMGKAYHRNLIKLYGYCFNIKFKALVYEFMENGSLDKILYGNHFNTRSGIEWEKLYDIAIQTAKGIVYLHDGWDERIIHYDIKAANVLLDKNLSPKITDFGLAKFMKRELNDISLSRTRGTQGYNAPETWMPASRVTYKCDVYSFGMMLFEILGKRNNGVGENWFPEQVWKNFKNGQLDELLQDCDITEKDRQKAKILARVAFWCAQYTANIRPSMSDVVMMLENKIPVGMPPYPFQFGQSAGPSMPPSLQAISEVDSNLSSTTDESLKKTKGEKEKDAGENRNADSFHKEFASNSTSSQPFRSTLEQNTSSDFANYFLKLQNHYQDVNNKQFHNMYSTMANQVHGKVPEEDLNNKQFHSIYSTMADQANERILEEQRKWKAKMEALKK
ncbi:Pr5-like receptor kinase [Thalictrum thalictroides]|uniref:non-specific serine/threonine protein kinase n=1 Tax=Thalictrum thalictroides TaxID=46969 RepID=A0A7J6W3A9_THATH|nr:Pr5-like receptor kinase [Thalictrum thalictroides]